MSEDLVIIDDVHCWHDKLIKECPTCRRHACLLGLSESEIKEVLSQNPIPKISCLRN